MSWFRIDDQSAFDEKVLAAGDDGWGLLCRAGAWSSAYGTDGVIPLPTAAALCGSAARWRKLVACGLVEKRADAYVISKFLKWNPTAASVRAERDRKRANLNAHRDRTRNRPETGFTTGHETDLKPVSRPDGSHAEITVPIPVPEEIQPEPSPPLSPPENRAAPAAAADPVLTELRRHPKLADIATTATAAEILGLSTASGTPLELVVAAIADAAFDLPECPTESAARAKIRAFVKSAKRIEATRRARPKAPLGPPQADRAWTPNILTEGPDE